MSNDEKELKLYNKFKIRVDKFLNINCAEFTVKHIQDKKYRVHYCIKYKNSEIRYLLCLPYDNTKWKSFKKCYVQKWKNLLLTVNEDFNKINNGIKFEDDYYML